MLTYFDLWRCCVIASGGEDIGWKVGRVVGIYLKYLFLLNKYNLVLPNNQLIISLYLKADQPAEYLKARKWQQLRSRNMQHIAWLWWPNVRIFLLLCNVKWTFFCNTWYSWVGGKLLFRNWSIVCPWEKFQTKIPVMNILQQAVRVDIFWLG